jgi:hypothetical protein
MAGIAAATLLAGGGALAQSNGRGDGGMEGMGKGMHGRMGSGMHDHMGPGMRGGMAMHGQMGGGMHGQMGRGMHGGMGMHGAMGGGMHGRMGAGMHGGQGQAQLGPADLDSLKGELGITAAQELAWEKYAKALQEAAAATRSARDSVDPSRLSPAERFAYRSKMREQAQTRFDAVTTAAEELLAALDDAQKAKAEDTLPGLAFGPDPLRGAMGGTRHRH